MKVDVYRCLDGHKPTWTIKSREPESYGRVVAHEDTALVARPEFVVQKSGHDRMVDTGQRNVHAFVRGEWANEMPFPVQPSDVMRVRYEQDFPFFTDWNQTRRVKSADFARCFEDGTCTAIAPDTSSIEEEVQPK